MPKKATVSAQRSGDYTKNLKNVRLTSESIRKGRDSTVEVKRVLLQRVDETGKKITDLRLKKYEVYAAQLSAAQKNMKEAMKGGDTASVVAAAVEIVDYIDSHVKAEKADVAEIRALLRKAEKIMRDCENYENQCLVLIKKANAIAVSLNPKKTPFFLSRATFDSSSFIPQEQIEMIQLDMSVLHEDAQSADENGAEDGGDAQHDDDVVLTGKFKSSFDRAKVKRLAEIKKALLKDGMDALTRARREVSIELYEKCLRILKSYREVCAEWTSKLELKRPEIVNFFDSIVQQLDAMEEPLEYKHRIVTT